MVLDNPVLCDDRWPETMTAIEGQQARVYGSTQCVGMAIVNSNAPLSINGPSDIVDSIIAEDGTIIGGQNINTHKLSFVDDKASSDTSKSINTVPGSILAGSGLNLNDNRVQNQSGGSGLDNGVHKLHTDFSEVQKITSDQTLTVLTLNSAGQDDKTPIVVAPPLLLQPVPESMAVVDSTSSDEI